MSSLSNVFDWDFFWGIFGFFMKIVAPFIMLIVGIYAVGLLLKQIIGAIRGNRG